MLRRTLLLCSLSLIVVAGIGIIIIGNFNKTTLLRFESEPKAQVYVDNVKVGITPVEFETKKRIVNIRLAAYESDKLLPYETTLSLTPQTKVIVRRKLESDLGESSGQLLQFFKTHENSAKITFITNPSSSNIYLDSTYIGLSPTTFSPSEGVHHLKIEKEGYNTQEFDIYAATYFNVFVYADLLPTSDENSLSSKIARVLTNKSGTLYVRRSPSVYSPDLTRIFPGREYQILGFNEDNTWVNIRLNASESGWVQAKDVEVGALK